jgi:ribokinase
MDKKPKILVVGSFMMDLISKTFKVPGEGETITGQSFSTASGGKGANQAVQAALLGAEVTMVGKVGDDIFGARMIESLSAANVNVDNIVKDRNTASGVGNITLEVREGHKTKNRILILPGANMTLALKDIEFLKNEISKYDMVILQNEIPSEINDAIIAFAYSAGVPVMLNSAPSRPVSEESLSKLTYISPNEHEAYDLTGIKIKVNSSGVDFDTVKNVTNFFLNKGIKNVIVTLGSNGVVLANQNKFIFHPCIDVVDVVDPTAAGDSFVGAFCTGICSGMTEESAIEFASYAATLTVSRLGAQPALPTYSEVAELMDAVKRNGSNYRRVVI